jgi:hypothetical protein
MIEDKRNMALICYSQQSNFHRDIIKGSMRTQRCKIAILKLFQANLHFSFFPDKIYIYFFCFWYLWADENNVYKLDVWYFKIFLENPIFPLSCILDLSSTGQNFPCKMFEFPPNLKNSLSLLLFLPLSSLRTHY